MELEVILEKQLGRDLFDVVALSMGKDGRIVEEYSEYGLSQTQAVQYMEELKESDQVDVTERGFGTQWFGDVDKGSREELTN